MKKKLVLLLLIFVNFSAHAYSGNSLTWQKLALEEKVQRRFNASLSSLLKDNQYLVDIEVEVNEPGAPNLGNDNNAKGTRVSDINMDESRGDYIAFSKMGLEVPVVEKFLDEDRTKLMNLYRFNETYDLFKNISAVKVTVFLSDKIPEDLMAIVKKVIGSTKLAVSGIKPNVKFETMAMEWVDPAIALEKKKQNDENEKLAKKPEETEPKIWAKDWYEWASRWGNAVGLIFGSLIIGVIALFLFKQWKAFMEAYSAKQVQDQTNKNEEDKQEEDKLSAQNSNDPTQALQEDDVQSKHGLERFQQCLSQHPDEAINIVRIWLNDADDKSVMNLRAVAQQCSREEMEILMAGLFSDQCDKWKSFLGAHLESAEVALANKNIFHDVVKTLLVPSKIKDGELLNLIMELNAVRTCEFLEKNAKLVGIMMNILSPTTVSRVLAQISDDKVDQWLSEGSSFQDKNLETDLATLKEKLISFKAATSPSPFAQRIAGMIPSSSPTREASLYRALIKCGGIGMVNDVAKKNIPYELVMNLSPVLLRESLQSLPMAKRVEIISSRETDEQTALLDAVAEPNTPARDMMDMELENLKNDANKLSQITAQSEELWQEFVKVTRMLVSKNTAHSTMVNELVTEWSKGLAGGLKSIDGGKAA